MEGKDNFHIKKWQTSQMIISCNNNNNNNKKEWRILNQHTALCYITNANNKKGQERRNSMWHVCYLKMIPNFDYSIDKFSLRGISGSGTQHRDRKETGQQLFGEMLLTKKFKTPQRIALTMKVHIIVKCAFSWFRGEGVNRPPFDAWNGWFDSLYSWKYPDGSHCIYF